MYSVEGAARGVVDERLIVVVNVLGSDTADAGPPIIRVVLPQDRL